jgi:hypothetical protein
MYGFFDDSGTDASSPVAVMAGYVAHTAAWERFELKSKRLFHSERIPFFRAKLFDHGEKSFRGWTDARRLKFATTWYGFAQHNVLRGVSAGVHKADFAAGKAKDRKVPGISPQAYALQIALSHLFRDKEVWREIEKHGLQLVVESSVTADAGIRDDFQRIVNVNNLAKHLRPIIFATKKHCHALHLADYLAYYSHRFALTALHGSIKGRTPYLDIAQERVTTIMKLAEKFEPNPDYIVALARSRASQKRHT